MPARTIIVDTVPRQILPYFPQRVSVSIFNNSGSTAFVSQDPIRVVEDGFPIPVGGNLSLVAALGDEPAWALYAATSTGTAELRIFESFRRE